MHFLTLAAPDLAEAVTSSIRAAVERALSEAA